MCVHIHLSIYMCLNVCIWTHIQTCTSVYACAYLHRCVYVIQGVKDSEISRWLNSVMLLLWVSVRGGWLDSLVLDNCTLPRSVVPFSVSLWPRLQEPYLGCTSSSSYPVSSPSCPTHPHSAAGGRQRDSKWSEGQSIGAFGNCYYRTCFDFSVVFRIFVLDLFCGHKVAWFGYINVF